MPPACRDSRPSARHADGRVLAAIADIRLFRPLKARSAHDIPRERMPFRRFMLRHTSNTPRAAISAAIISRACRHAAERKLIDTTRRRYRPPTSSRRPRHFYTRPRHITGDRLSTSASPPIASRSRYHISRELDYLPVEISGRAFYSIIAVISRLSITITLSMRVADDE